MKIEPFLRQGRSLTIDYSVFEYIMPTLSPTQWITLCFIIMKTVGWNKERDAISYSQIKKGTGIKSDTTVSNAIGYLLEKEVIGSDMQSDGGWITSSVYWLNSHYGVVVDRTTENGVPSRSTPKNGDTVSNTIVKDNTIVLKKEKKVYKEKKEDGEFLSLLPERFLQSKEFVIVWKDFLQVRKEKKVPVTKTAAKRHIRLMNQYNIPVAIAMIDTALNKGWRGIFELEDWHPLMRGSNSPLSDAGESQRETLKSA